MPAEDAFDWHSANQNLGMFGVYSPKCRNIIKLQIKPGHVWSLFFLAMPRVQPQK